MNIFNPQVVVIGGGVIAAGELLLAPAREVMMERALAPGKDVVRVEAARFGPEAGMIGAGAARARHGRRRRHGRDRSAAVVSGRLVVCPTPIGNLEDVTLRVLAALREADVVACEDTRHTRVLLERYGVSATLVSYHEHNERARAAELVERMLRRRGRRAGSATPACRWSATPATRSCRAASPRGWRSRCCPGRRRALTALVASALPVRRLALRRLPAAQARGARGRLRRARDASSPSSRRGASAPRWPCSPSSTRSGPSRVCRELTKLHEEIVRGSAAELAARYAGEPPRGEIVLVVGGAPGAPGVDPAAVEAVRTLVESGAPRPRPRRRSSPSSPARPANALYRAVAT